MNPFDDKENINDETAADENAGAENTDTESAAAENTDTENAATDSTGGEAQGEPDYTYRVIKPDAERTYYRDASYVPQDETTAPPRYYVPDEKKPPEKTEPPKKGGISFAKVVCLCLVCALLGGVSGGLIAAGTKSGSGDTASATTDTPTLSVAETTQSTSTTATPVSATSAQSIYDLACEQVVGVNTEITTNVFGTTVSSAVSGSGFIITEDGYILTNYHVIEDAYKGGYDVSVILYSGDTYVADIIGFDEDNDVAVLKIDATGLSPVTLGNSDAISVGDTVYAVGNPLGELAYTMTSGIVSATDRVISTSETVSINVFQFDAAVNEGNSGGPLYNANGEVIGIVTAKYSDTGIEGLSFAIPINDAVNIANDIITNGYVTGKPYMGIMVQTVTSTVAKYYNMVEGAYVYSVNTGSAAETAGLKTGDIITDMNGVAITSSDELEAAIKTYSAGDTVSVTVWRSGEYVTLTLIFDEETPSNSASETTTDSSTSTTTPGMTGPNSQGGYPGNG